MKQNYFFLSLVIITSVSCHTGVDEHTFPKKESTLELLGFPGKQRIVFISGDEEYRSEEALPQLAKILNKHYGFNCTVLFAQDTAKSGVINPNVLNNIPGLEKLEIGRAHV